MIIVSTTMQDLESAAGCAVTGGGTQVHHVIGWTKDNGNTNIDVGWPAAGTTGSPNRAGPSPSATASSNGFRHPNSTPAKPAPTSTTPEHILRPPDEDDP
jgi:hypothetical protein